MNLKDQLIQKLFANQCTKNELSLLFELIQKDGSETAPEVMMTLFQQMDKVPSLDLTTSKRILGKVLKETVEMESMSKDHSFRLQSRKRIIWIGRVAAAVLLLVVASWSFYQYVNPSKLMVQTGFGQQQSIELPDGSQVKLNANSSLTFEKEWNNQDIRKVWLDGEAFFEVEKKMETDQKFQVITKDLTVEVLSTIFNVNSHQKETKVYLEEGKIKLNFEGLEQDMFMEPGEIVAYSKSQKSLPEKRMVAPVLHTSWKDGHLIFENTPLRTVLEKLEEIYGVSILVKDTANYSTEITGGVPLENLDESIKILDATLTDLIILKAEDGFVIQKDQ